MSNNKASGVDNTFRRKWDKEEFRQRARERSAKKSEEEKDRQKPGSPTQRKPLEQREYDVDLEARLGRTQVVTPITPINQQAGYFCDVCQCVVKDSANFLDHINGKKHQRNLGMSMRVKRSTLSEVQERFQALKKRQSETRTFTEEDLDLRIKQRMDEEEALKRSKREKKKEKKLQEKAKAEEITVEAIDQDVAELMGFGGFGTSSKKV